MVSIIWSLMTCSKMSLALAMTPFLMIFSTSFLTLIAIFISTIICLSPIILLFIELTVQLHAEGVDLEQEDDTGGFLGVHIKRDPNTGFLNITPKGLIKQLLETLGLDVGTANGKLTPAKGKPLANHAQGEPASGDFNYSRVVGMLSHLAGHTCPDII